MLTELKFVIRKSSLLKIKNTNILGDKTEFLSISKKFVSQLVTYVYPVYCFIEGYLNPLRTFGGQVTPFIKFKGKGIRCASHFI